MSALRRKEDRRWIQLEVPSDRGNTAFINLDMNMIDHVSFVRDGEKMPPDQVTITSSAIVAPVVLRGEAAHFFYSAWNDYADIAEAMDPLPAGVIHRVGGGPGVVNMK